MEAKDITIIDYQKMLEEKEAIAFKAGQREVVAWIKQGDITRPIRWGWNDPPPNRTIEIKLEAFLNKLKEWGLE